jgi:uncharacterized protein
MNSLSLFELIILDNKSTLMPLLEKIQNINTLNDEENNLLQVALTYERIEIAFELIKRGINVNNQNNSGQTALHYSAEPNKLEIAKVIMDHGGDLSIEDKYGNTPLWTATFEARGKYDVVSLFIQRNANPYHKNKNNKSPLDFAKQINDYDLVKVLST